MSREQTTSLPHVFPTVVHMLTDAAARSPDAIALACDEKFLSYAQYLRCVTAFARELRAHCSRGDRIALVCGNSIDMPIAMFAAHAAGAQVVPINPAYTARELSYILDDSDPAAIIYDSEVAATVEPLIKSIGIKYAVCRGKHGRSLDAWRDDIGQALTYALPQPADFATLQYTGGTTGKPKGVNITHGQMAVNISQRESALPTYPDDERILCMMPLFHVFAVAMCLHLATYCRGRLIILPRYKPQIVLKSIEQERITRLPAGPTVFIGLLNDDRVGATDFSSLRSAYSGSAPLPEETLRGWQEITGSPILEGFGQTEAGPVLTYVRDGGPSKVGSSGPPLPLTEIEIVDVETGKQRLRVGDIGEVRARGPQVMSGYRNKPQETAEALRDGWLYTGDIGELDADGYLYIRDRKKDMAIVGGYNVYPREVNEVLFTHPSTKEAASAGVPDRYYGETICAYVVLKPGACATVDDLIAHCKKNLAPYKVPSRIFIVDALPRTIVGKIDSVALRQELAAAVRVADDGHAKSQAVLPD